LEIIQPTATWQQDNYLYSHRVAEIILAC